MRLQRTTPLKRNMIAWRRWFRYWAPQIAQRRFVSSPREEVRSRDRHPYLLKSKLTFHRSILARWLWICFWIWILVCFQRKPSKATKSSAMTNAAAKAKTAKLRIWHPHPPAEGDYASPHGPDFVAGVFGGVTYKWVCPDEEKMNVHRVHARRARRLPRFRSRFRRECASAPPPDHACQTIGRNPGHFI